MNIIETNISVARRFLDALAVLDFDALSPMLAPDFVLDSKGSTSLSGPRPLSDLPILIQMMRKFLPAGATLEVLSVTADETRVACEAKGDAVTAAGKPYRNQYLFLIELRGGKVVKCSEYMDTRLLDEHLGPLIQQLTASKP
jgi:uncharacterized protein